MSGEVVSAQFDPALCARLIRSACSGIDLTGLEMRGLAEQLNAASIEIRRLRGVALFAGTIRNMRFAVDSRLTAEERRAFDGLSQAWDAWKFPG